MAACNLLSHAALSANCAATCAADGSVGCFGAGMGGVGGSFFLKILLSMGLAETGKVGTRIVTFIGLTFSQEYCFQSVQISTLRKVKAKVLIQLAVSSIKGLRGAPMLGFSRFDRCVE